MLIVLILILLEYGLRQQYEELKRQGVHGLNPYSIGIWSATVYVHNDTPRSLMS